jgi:hypothetical protein
MNDASGHQLTHEQLLPFQGLHDIDGLCHVRVYEQNGRLPVVIAGELDDHPGTKISNGIEMVAHAVKQEFFPDGREFLLVEHHPGLLLDGGKPTFQLVHLSHADSTGRPQELGASAGILVLCDDDGNQAVIGRSLVGNFRDPSWSTIASIESVAGCTVKTWPKGRYTARAIAGLRGEYRCRQVAARGRDAADRLIAVLAEH